MRNEWCNDAEVQRTLKPLLDKKTIKFLRPSGDLTQFGQTNSLKRGIETVNEMWRSKWMITARGIRRALWAEDDKDLQNVSDIALSAGKGCLTSHIVSTTR
jgi:xeroderma pigmentosum group C-complementing protein